MVCGVEGVAAEADAEDWLGAVRTVSSGAFRVLDNVAVRMRLTVTEGAVSSGLRLVLD